MLLQTSVYRLLFKHLFLIFWGYIPRSGIDGSCGNFVFNFLRNSQSVNDFRTLGVEAKDVDDEVKDRILQHVEQMGA